MNKFKKIFCILFRHSNILENCMGYKYCGRCGEQLGDSLAGVYSNDKAVYIGHNCPTCEENYKKLTWVDKFLVPNPFKEPVYE